jgi:hypothetical protein
VAVVRRAISLALPRCAARQAPEAGQRDVQTLGEPADAGPHRTLDGAQRGRRVGQSRGLRHEPATQPELGAGVVERTLEDDVAFHGFGNARHAPAAAQSRPQQAVDQRRAVVAGQVDAARHALEDAEAVDRRLQQRARNGQGDRSSAHGTPCEVRPPSNLLVMRLARKRAALRTQRLGCA